MFETYANCIKTYYTTFDRQRKFTAAICAGRFALTKCLDACAAGDKATLQSWMDKFQLAENFKNLQAQMVRLESSKDRYQM